VENQFWTHSFQFISCAIDRENIMRQQKVETYFAASNSGVASRYARHAGISDATNANNSAPLIIHHSCDIHTRPPIATRWEAA
jgi:hypothetical protein